MNHKLCITKAFNEAATLYKNNWKACLLVGMTLAGFWMLERNISNHLSTLDTYIKHNLLQAPNAVAVYQKTTSAILTELTFSRPWQEYAILAVLSLALLYLILCSSRFFLLLYTKKPFSLSSTLVSFGLLLRAFAALLFAVLICLVLAAAAGLIMKLGDWFLLSFEHKILILFVYLAIVAIPVLTSVIFIPWCTVDQSTSVSQVVDKCMHIVNGCRFKIVIVYCLVNLASFVMQFFLLSVLYNPLVRLGLMQVGVFITFSIVLPFSYAVWTSVYQQIKQ